MVRNKPVEVVENWREKVESEVRIGEQR